MITTYPGCSLAFALAALYNVAGPIGRGFEQYDPEPMTLDAARDLIDAGQRSFDYLRGRCMKITLDEDDAGSVVFDATDYNAASTRGYGRVYEKMFAMNVLEIALKHNDPACKEILESHRALTYLNARETLRQQKMPVICQPGVFTLRPPASIIPILEKIIADYTAGWRHREQQF